nr:urease accessory protein UreF [Desulfobulbaceae bacterium]
MPNTTNSFPGVSQRLRLLQLASPSLPVGGYAYSRGMEYAVETGWLTCENDTSTWIFGLLDNAFARTDIPILKRIYKAWLDDDIDSVHYWNNYLFAMRESAEFQFEEANMGKALARLLVSLDFTEAREWQLQKNASFACLFALAAVRWQISLEDSCCGYVWAWLENQVAAAIKLVPLGQTSGQIILSGAIAHVEKSLQTGLSISDDEIGYAAPALAMASAFHETQHTRLFRS